MLYIFYMVTPFILSSNKLSCLRNCIICWIIIYGVQKITTCNDHRILLYSIFYFLGMFYDITCIQNHIRLLYSLSIIHACVLYYSFGKTCATTDYLLMFVLGITGIPFLYLTSYLCCKYRPIRKMMLTLSFSSMMAYLLHRYLYHYLYLWLEHFPYYAQIPIFLLSVFVCSYSCQTLYDIILSSRISRIINRQ